MTKKKDPSDLLDKGAPTKFREEYCEQARKLCLLGYTDEELADFFGVCTSTIDNWKNEYPDFMGSITAGKDPADGNVVNALYNRALGATTTEGYKEVIEGVVVEEKTTTKEYPPDTAACKLWLMNRQSKRWKEKHDVELNGKIEINIDSDDADV